MEISAVKNTNDEGSDTQRKQLYHARNTSGIMLPGTRSAGRLPNKRPDKSIRASTVPCIFHVFGACFLRTPYAPH